jgi:hypothetical protein
MLILAFNNNKNQEKDNNNILKMLKTQIKAAQLKNKTC